MDDESPTYNSLRATNPEQPNKSGPAAIDRALNDLHMNIGDTHQLLTELEAKISPVLAPDLTTIKEITDLGSEPSENSRIYDTIRAEDASVVELQARLRNLFNRVEL